MKKQKLTGRHVEAIAQFVEHELDNRTTWDRLSFNLREPFAHLDIDDVERSAMVVFKLKTAGRLTK